ncbi:MAG: hypothetical protein LC649_05695 [Bacteroidales bacterium]|nr:hypothetical protein [Bacteroidales bacterium]
MTKLLVLTALVVLISSGCSNRGVEAELLLEPLETGSSVSIRALHIVNENVVWAGGSQGTFLLSANGGESWKVGSLPVVENEEFRSIHGWDSQHALMFGIQFPGRGYHTSTAGEEWDIVYENDTPGIFFNSARFADARRGIALSDAVDSVPFVIRTADGGESWERVTDLPPLKRGEYHFAASNSCIEYLPSGQIWIITGGGDARVFFSSDHGESWSVYDTPVRSASPSTGIFSVAFSDPMNGLVMGGTYDNPVRNDSIAAYTSDGGVTWNLAETMPAEFRSQVLWLDPVNETAIAVGKTGWDYTLDGGKNWIHLSDSGYYVARSIPGTKTGFAAGSDGRIARFELKIR